MRVHILKPTKAPMPNWLPLQNMHYDDAFQPSRIAQAQLGGHGRPGKNIDERIA